MHTVEMIRLKCELETYVYLQIQIACYIPYLVASMIFLQFILFNLIQNFLRVKKNAFAKFAPHHVEPLL